MGRFFGVGFFLANPDLFCRLEELKRLQLGEREEADSINQQESIKSFQGYNIYCALGSFAF